MSPHCTQIVLSLGGKWYLMHMEKGDHKISQKNVQINYQDKYDDVLCCYSSH